MPTASLPTDPASDAVSTPERIVEALYAAISRPAGVAPDWDGFRALFAPGARICPAHTGADGERTLLVLDVEEYIRAWSGALAEHGFEEREVAHRTERAGGVAHVWSSYESRHDPSDAEPFMRGVNSIQLYHDGRRWWVLTVFWERSENVALQVALPSRHSGTR